MNMALKLAIVQSGRTQRAIAKSARMPEMRVCRIVYRDSKPPTPREKQKLARVLKQPVESLFPVMEVVS